VSAVHSSSPLALVEFENFYNFLSACSVDAGVCYSHSYSMLEKDNLLSIIEDVKKRLLSKSILLFSLRHKKKSYKNRLYFLLINIRRLKSFEKKLSIISAPPVRVNGI